jgi:hypothetical protein
MKTFAGIVRCAVYYKESFSKWVKSSTAAISACIMVYLPSSVWGGQFGPELTAIGVFAERTSEV